MVRVGADVWYWFNPHEVRIQLSEAVPTVLTHDPVAFNPLQVNALAVSMMETPEHWDAL